MTAAPVAAAAGALAVVAGLTAIQILVAGVPRVPPVGAVDALPWIAAAGAAAGLATAGRGPAARVAAGILVLIGGIGWTVAPLAARGVAPVPALTVLAVAGGTVVLRERSGAIWPLPAMLAAGLAAAAAFGAALGLAALLAGYALLAAVLAGAARVSGQRLVAAETALLGALGGASAILAQYASPSPWALLLLAPLPAVDALVRNRPLARAVEVTLVAVAAVAARADASGLLAP